jgi:hypothetical protein
VLRAYSMVTLTMVVCVIAVEPVPEVPVTVKV